LAVNVTDGGATPVPYKLTAVGLLDALETILKSPLKDPEALGLKVTEIVQVALAVSDVSQPFVSANEDEFAPPSVAPLIDSDPVPVLVTIIDCAALVVPVAWLEKVKLAELTEIAGALVVQVTEILVTLPLPTVPLPLVTTQFCAGLEGCVRTVTL